jgi:murein DD-endopeptidase MepM/ murein hydrolase activator NlpD
MLPVNRHGFQRLVWLFFGGLLTIPVVAQQPPLPVTPPPDSKSGVVSQEREKFKGYLATGGIDRRPKAAPDTFLPPGNVRTSEPGAVRVYKKDKDGNRIDPQPKGYPKTVNPETFKPDHDEFVRVHEGIDYSSRDPKGIVRAMDFKAGVYGRIVEVGTANRLGRIKVEVDERKNRVEYLHTSKTYVKVGDQVKPDTLLGMTGDKAAGGQIHLHVQARNKENKAINPDEVVTYAKKPPSERKAAEFFVPMKWREGLLPATADYDIMEKARKEARDAEEERKRLEKEFK